MVTRRRSSQSVTIGIAGSGHMSRKDVEKNLEDYFDALPNAVEFVVLFSDTATQKIVREVLTQYDAKIQCVMLDADDVQGEENFAKEAKAVVVKSPANKFARMLIEASETGDARLLTFWDDEDPDLDRAVTLVNEAGIPILSVGDGMQTVTLTVQEEEAPAAEESAEDALAGLTWTRDFFKDYEPDALREVKKLLGLSSRGRFAHDSAVTSILEAAAAAGYEVSAEELVKPKAAVEAEPEPEPEKPSRRRQKAEKVEEPAEEAPKPRRRQKAAQPAEAPVELDGKVPTTIDGAPLVEVTMVIPRSVLRELIAEAVAKAN